MEIIPLNYGLLTQLKSMTLSADSRIKLIQHVFNNILFNVVKCVFISQSCWFFVVCTIPDLQAVLLVEAACQ